MFVPLSRCLGAVEATAVSRERISDNCHLWDGCVHMEQFCTLIDSNVFHKYIF